MKKIGILTFHNAMSYGAVLQAYALQTMVHSLGQESEIIDYMCEDIYNAHVRIIPKTKNLKFNLKMTLMGRKRYQWRSLLRKFRKECLVESRYVTKEELEKLGKEYQMIIAGSDQVFNDVCTKFDATYFLNFVPDEKKYTYAASFGMNRIPTDLREEYTRRLEGFQELSIREQTGCEIVRDLLHREASCNIDPSFLLKANEWDQIERHRERKPYIFVFTVLKPLGLIDYALELGKKKNLDVLYLENYAFPKRKGLKYIGPVSPREFIGLIKNAQYVVTNSFHGMAFSIIYHKRFMVELNTAASRNIRCEELLDKLGIQNNDLSDKHMDIDQIEYCWDHVDEVVEQERTKSKAYLTQIMSGENE